MGAGYKAKPSGTAAILAQFKDLQEAQAALNRRMTALGIEIDPNGNVNIGTGQLLTVDGDEVVNGDLTTNGDTVVDGSLTTNGNAAIKGKMTTTGDVVIQGNLAVPNGSIKNDALQNPLKTQAYFAQASNYAVGSASVSNGGTATIRASFTVTVPDGFTSALLWVTAQDYALNSGSVQDYLHSCVNVGGSGADWVQASSGTVPGGMGGASIVVTSYLRTGLSGGSQLSVQSRPFVEDHSWAAYSGNSTVLSGLAFFFR